MAENSNCAEDVNYKSRALRKSLECPRRFEHQKIQKG